MGAPEVVRLVIFGCRDEEENQIKLSDMLHNVILLTRLHFLQNAHS